MTWTFDCKPWEAKKFPYLAYINLSRQQKNRVIEYMWEIGYDSEETTACIADNEHKLMEDELGVYNTVISSIEDETGDLYWFWRGGYIPNERASKFY